MAETKPRPDNVPAENEYHSTHWLLIAAYLAAIAATAILIMNAG